MMSSVLVWTLPRQMASVRLRAQAIKSEIRNKSETHNIFRISEPGDLLQQALVNTARPTFSGTRR